MGFTEPDSAPAAPGQQPQAATPGPAPAPYAGPDLRPEPRDYGPPADAARDPGIDVMGGVSGNAVQESGYAHDMNAGLVVPYYGGEISPGMGGGGDGGGGPRDVAGYGVGGGGVTQCPLEQRRIGTHLAGRRDQVPV